MHLQSLASQTFRIAGEHFAMKKGETIWIESSYKYDMDRLGRLVIDGGFRIAQLWTDVEQLVWVALLQVT